MRRERGHFLTGFVVTLGFALAAVLIYAAYVLYAKEPAPVPAVPDAGVRPPRPKPMPSAGTTVTVGEADKQALLATRSPEKRNQILVVDLFLQILGRYPDAKEQAEWLEAGSTRAEELLEMRRRGDSDAAIANHVAGSLLETAASSGRVPLVRAPKSAKAWKRGFDPPGDGAACVGAMIARGLDAESAGTKDEVFLRKIERQYGLPLDGEARLGTVLAMLRDVTSSTDVVLHLRVEGSGLDVELDAIRTALRAGRLVAVNGADSKAHGRYVLLIGFDDRGDFLVRDPLDRMSLRIGPAVLQAFLQKSGLKGAAALPGFWIDIPGKRGHCRPGIPAAQIPSGLESLVLEPPPGGMTGVVPGAQENLTPSRIPPGEHTMRGTASMTAEQIDQVLAAAKSPAAGTGASFARWGRYYNVDPAWALAFFRRESLYGTQPNWIGRINDELTTRNIGNLRYVKPHALSEPQYKGFSGFRDYGTWDDGIHDWFQLVVEGPAFAGLHTVERVVPAYAPPFESDTRKYIGDVVTWVEEWRSESRAALASHHLQPAVASAEAACGGP